MNDSNRLNQLFFGDEDEAEALPSFSLLHPGVEPVGVAHIASNLEPLTADTVKAGSRAFIVGNDGRNISPDYERWLKLLKAWLTKGCEVTYLLVNAGADVLNELKEIKRQLPQNAGELFVYTIEKQTKLNGEAAEYVKQWETFHFIVFENPSQLWVEKCHKPGDTCATGCSYVPEEVAKRPGLPDVYKSRFEYVIKNFASPVDCAA